jgi:glutathione synthase/RimK-type ligase-like ATP-grasp enzyme
MKNKFKTAILANELKEDHLPWIEACKKYKDKIDYRIIDLTRNNWLKEIQFEQVDFLLTKPGGLSSHFKQLYDERIYLLEKVLGYPVFPSAEEIFIYENKRFFSFWCDANRIPHPQTEVFYHPEEADKFLSETNFPVVGKASIGASGSGIQILKDRAAAMQYTHEIFKGKGAKQRTGPNLNKGGLLKRGFHYILNPGDITGKLFIYRSRSQGLQKGFVIFQQFIPHEFEWRVVRIGDSFFAHKKLKKGDKASGSLLKGYENPPLEILAFVKEITDKHHFYSQAVDIFESDQGYLVNEMQCIFGQSDPYQMLVDGKPGRYRFLNKEWIFEEGMFNTNECYDLRMEYILNKLDKA